MLTEHQKDELARYTPQRERRPLTDLAMWQQAESREEQLRRNRNAINNKIIRRSR